MILFLFGGSSTDEYVEALDSTRVHPETYDWARKMAVDAMDLEDEDTPAIALEQILLTPERLNYLDLGAFAKELARQVTWEARLGYELC